MRRLILLCVITGATGMATAARAEGPYVGVDGGVYIPQRLAYNFIGLSDFFSTKYSKGYDVDAKLGYDFEGLRIEFEGGYRQAQLHEFGFRIQGQPLLVKKGSAVSGNIHTISAMVNGYWDITQKRFRPYVGAGVGVARFTSDQVGYAGYGDSGIFLNKSDTAFAFQLMAGVQARVTRHLYANVGYRYFDVERVHLSVFNATAGSAVRSSSVQAGITYKFGRSVADLPPPPIPPAVVPSAPETALSPPIPDAAPATATVQTSFTISFGPNSAVLSADSRAALDQVAAAYRQIGHAAVMVTGSAATSVQTIYNERLAQARAATAKAYLVSKGIIRSTISVQSFDGPTPSGKPGLATSPASIQITFGLGSGQ